RKRYLSAVRDTVSFPFPLRTVTTLESEFAARSVTVTVMPFVPATMGTLSENVPSFLAAPVTVRPVASLRAASALRPCVLPVIVATSPLTPALSLGDVIWIVGLVLSWIHVTTGDGSLSFEGPTIVAKNGFLPLTSG